MFNSKKGIGPVVASGLLLVVAIVSIVGFQTWFNNYSSITFSNVESQSGDSVGSTNIDTISNNYLYFKNSNSGNVTIQSVKVGGVDCSVSQEISNGLTGINISSCLANLTTRNVDVVVITNQKVYSKKVYLQEISLSGASGGSSLIISIGVNDTSIYFRDYVNVSWNITGTPSSCSGSNGWSGSKSTSSSSEVIQVYSDLNFTLTCDSVEKSVNISVYDPYWSSVVLLTSFEGTNGATTYIDNSSNSVSLTNVGSGAINTSNSILGSSSYYIPDLGEGTSSHILTETNTTLFDMGSSDFTVEGWFYISDLLENSDALFSIVNDANQGLALGIIDVGGGIMSYYPYEWPENNGLNGTQDIENQTWFHFAFQRTGSTYEIYENGTKIYTHNLGSTKDYGTNKIAIGAWPLGANRYLQDSFIDEFRVTKGVARYTSDFSTPVYAYPTK